MRVVSFVDHLELEFEGNVLKNAVCLGDVDNNGLNELVVGNEKGDVAIFKGDCTKPYYCCCCTGMITAVAIGDICNIGKNMLVVITNCGFLYIFDFEEGKSSEKKPAIPIHKQHLPANIKTALIGDINGDGLSELVVAMTDRVVRAYGWISAGDLIGNRPYGKLIGLNKWELSDQIGNIAFNKSGDSTSLLVAQPGGTHFTIKYNPNTGSGDSDCLKESSSNLAHKRLRNQNIHTEILGNIQWNNDSQQFGESSSPYAVATLDGTLMLVHNDTIKCNLQVDHQLFALANLDMTGDGREELLACAWDGNTYIVRPTHNSDCTDCVRFSFPEPVHSFTAGQYGYKGKQTPSLVYVTFTGRIFLYYNVQIPILEPTTLTEILKNDPKYLQCLETLGISVDDTVKIRELHSRLLYNFDKCGSTNV